MDSCNCDSCLLRRALARAREENRELRARVAELEDEAKTLSKAVLDGHGIPCLLCGEDCNALVGNPGRWPIGFCYRSEPGVVKYHCTTCVEKRMS